MSNEPKGFNPEYDDRKISNLMYFGKANEKEDGSTYRKVELFIDEEVGFLTEKNADDLTTPVDFKVRDSLTLFAAPSGQQKIQCWLMETVVGKHIDAIHISRRTGKGVYGSQEVTLSGQGLISLYEFIKNLFVVETDGKTTLPITSVNDNSTSSHRLITDEEFIELIKTNIKSTNDFHKLLSIQKMELAVERLEEIIAGGYKNEVDIQHFLKDNLWMFGNEYAHIVENGRINAKNILDMAPKNYESYVDIIEVKLPVETLFNYDNSHQNHYCTSSLTKAIAQTQNYIYELDKKVIDEEYQCERDCKIVRPKGLILYGSKEPMNEAEQQYLRVLNASYHNIHIITYQQLLAKAQNSVNVWKKAK